MDPQSAFLEAIPLIERIVRAIARRTGLDDDERADFESWVHVRLIEGDYAVLRKFRKRASLSTFLTVVINNLFVDYRNTHWGRWRASAQAKRLGRIAVRLERLLYRDGCTLSEAISEMLAAERELTERDLTELAAQLPVRVLPRVIGEAALWSVPADQQPDDDLQAEEDEGEASAVERTVHESLGALSLEDQTICRLIYWEGFTVAEVARTLHLPQKPLYRRIERLRSVIRRLLEARGVDRRRARRLLTGRDA